MLTYSILANSILEPWVIIYRMHQKSTPKEIC